MRGFIVLIVLLGTASSIPVELESSSNIRYDETETALPDKSTRHSDHDDKHTHQHATQEDIKMSMEEITAQLMNDPLISIDDVAGNTPPDGIEAITEGQAKVVVDHIKGLLSDIYTNSVVQGEKEEMNVEYKTEVVELDNKTEENQVTTQQPTILEFFSHLQQDTIHDKESLLSILQDFTTNMPDSDETKSSTSTPSLFIFQDLDTTTVKATAEADVRDASTTTTTTTTTRRTTRRNTTTTTTTTSTTPRPQPTPPTVFKIVDQSFGGVFSGFGNLASTIFLGRPLFGEGGDEQQNNWLFGRKRREVSDYSATRDEVTAHQIFQKFRKE